jgi:hypothetical protein
MASSELFTAMDRGRISVYFTFVDKSFIIFSILLEKGRKHLLGNVFYLVGCDEYAGNISVDDLNALKIVRFVRQFYFPYCAIYG